MNPSACPILISSNTTAVGERDLITLTWLHWSRFWKICVTSLSSILQILSFKKWAIPHFTQFRTYIQVFKGPVDHSLYNCDIYYQTICHALFYSFVCVPSVSLCDGTFCIFESHNGAELQWAICFSYRGWILYGISQPFPSEDCLYSWTLNPWRYWKHFGTGLGCRRQSIHCDMQQIRSRFPLEACCGSKIVIDTNVDTDCFSVLSQILSVLVMEIGV